jgi:uncharacterized protein (TIGR00369 family)
VIQFPVHIPFVQSLGFELLRCEGGEAEVAVNVKPELLNSWQVMHGGVVMTLLDVAMAHAARSIDGLQGPGVVTVEMKTSFMRPSLGRLRGVGQLLHRSSTMAFTDGRVFNEQGELCAHGSGTFKYLRSLPVSAREVQVLQRTQGVTSGL